LHCIAGINFKAAPIGLLEVLLIKANTRNERRDLKQPRAGQSLTWNEASRGIRRLQEQSCAYS